MEQTPHTPTYASTQTLIADGSSITTAVWGFGLDNHRNSQRTVVARFIAQVEWNRAQVYAGKNNSRWLVLMDTVHRLKQALEVR
tara:strand:+ start:1037 stop:1288 length:252 start_codon:yes stop_codon:yes gene_type:complete